MDVVEVVAEGLDAIHAEVNNLTGMARRLVTERNQARAERDAARDLAARLEAMLGGIELLHDASHYCRGHEEGEWRSWFYKGDATDRCLTYRLAHGTDQ